MAYGLPVTVRTVLDGLHLPECPRWHDGGLWLCDMWGHEVLRIAADGEREVVHRFPDDDDPGGIGWLPDGTMLVVGMERRVVHRLEDGRATVHADLSHLSPFQLNDMVVGADGTAYVTQFGWDLWGGGEYRDSEVIRVRPDGTADVAATDMGVPNGIALTDDGGTLVVAEPGAARISRFTVGPDGGLSDRSVVELETAPGATRVAPDGLCLDEQGGIWFADPMGARVVHLGPDGRPDRELAFPDEHPLACVLGGPDRRTLYVCVGGVVSKPRRPPDPGGRLVAIEVDVAGAGRP